MRRAVLAITTAAAVVAGSLLGIPHVAAAPPLQEQWRGYWVDSFRPSIYTPENVDKLVADARAVKANALIVQVGRWMDCFCNRSAFPRTHVAIAPDFDPLDDVIAKAHAAGIEVHAWVNATPMWNLATPPPNPDHVFHTHGPSASGADRWLNKRVDGAEKGGANLRTIDPANPAAADYVVDGIASIVDEYDVDGINLDYIRYPDYNSVNYQSDWGYSETSLARFRAATGRTNTPAPTDEQFSQWRRDQVTTLLRKIYLRMYQQDRQARLSINGITYWYGPQTEGGWERTRAYSEVMQDWKGWLAEGIIDTNVAMNYKVETTVGDRIRMFDEWNEVLADWQAGRQTVVGPALYLNTVENSVAQARRALAPSAAGNRVVGWNGYSYATPSNAGSNLDAERARLAHALTRADPTGAEPLFADPAKMPSMPWKKTPTTGHISGTVVHDGTTLDQATVTLTDPATGRTVATRLSDGSGWYGFVDVPPGQWLVTVSLPDGDTSHLIRVREGKVTTAP